MKTYATAENARTAAKLAGNVLHHVTQIIHATEGVCYVVAGAPAASLRILLVKHPMPEVVRVIDSAPVTLYEGPTMDYAARARNAEIADAFGEACPAARAVRESRHPSDY